MGTVKNYVKECEYCSKSFKTDIFKQRFCCKICAGNYTKEIKGPYLKQKKAQEKLAHLIAVRKATQHTVYNESEEAGNIADGPGPASLDATIYNEGLTCGEGGGIDRRAGVRNPSAFSENEGLFSDAFGGSTSSTPQLENLQRVYTKGPGAVDKGHQGTKGPGAADKGPENTQKTSHKSATWLEGFLEFISELKIDSKERGVIPLKESLYRGQWLFLQQVCKGLDEGIREFTCLKARQLGITTISLALDLFWAFVHDGLQAAFIAHEESAKEKTREILRRYMDSLPSDLKVSVVKNNRHSLVLSNGSIMDYLVAGTTKRTKSLGRGRAYTTVHGTEMAFYGNQDAVDSFVAALAKNHVDRLRIWESTANGFDSPMWEKWSSAKEDTATQRTIFIGWWGNDTYDVSSDPKLMTLYGGEPSHEEEQRIQEVYELYGVHITIGMLAWYRWYQSTQSKSPNMMMQEFPWTEDEAFISTGSKFFDQKRVADDVQNITNNFPHFEGYKVSFGEKFLDTKIERIEDPKFLGEVNFRVWERPKAQGTYIISCDPAYGSNDNKDRSVIEVHRCYADRLVQVAEFADEDPLTHQVAWILAWIAGKYANCMINLEVSGPGGVILLEFRHLKELAQAGMLAPSATGDPHVDDPAREERETFLDNMAAARWYVWNRPDSMGVGYAYGWKTNSENKVAALNAMRDCHVTSMLTIKSLPLLGEMQNIVQNGWDIRASGSNKDDRVMAAALGVWGWQQWQRAMLIAEGLTYAHVNQIESQTQDPKRTFMQALVQNHMSSMEAAKEAGNIAGVWDSW